MNNPSGSRLLAKYPPILPPFTFIPSSCLPGVCMHRASSIEIFMQALRFIVLNFKQIKTILCRKPSPVDDWALPARRRCPLFFPRPSSEQEVVRGVLDEPGIGGVDSVIFTVSTAISISERYHHHPPLVTASCQILMYASIIHNEWYYWMFLAEDTFLAEHRRYTE